MTKLRQGFHELPPSIDLSSWDCKSFQQCLSLFTNATPAAAEYWSPPGWTDASKNAKEGFTDSARYWAAPRMALLADNSVGSDRSWLCAGIFITLRIVSYQQWHMFHSLLLLFKKTNKPNKQITWKKSRFGECDKIIFWSTRTVPAPHPQVCH